ncbi:cyanate hydratase [Eikenella sp. NML99-0057]|uniref:cyanate hydratase n=1 Tax=Eikenella sp. NML99-0057 TaxID=1795834 RepID=UPI0007E07A6F|nr:cyanate hydratase [Eikenella sp. NML99-0057]OAM46186.1 cyanate hydratase [Eikenella sp. NML99-0057]
MPTRKQTALQTAAKLKQGKTARLKEWQAVSAQRQFANEYTVAARFGEPAFTEEQAEMVAALFGK